MPVVGFLYITSPDARTDAHHPRELAGDGEAETGAAEAPRGRGIGLAEFLEPQALNFVGGTSDFRSGRSGWYGMEPGKWALEALAAVESETRHLVHTEAA
jgi:hypothetical protein